MNIAQLPDAADLASLSDYEFQKLIVGAVHTTQEDRKQNAILYYRPVSAKVQAIHDCTAKCIGIGGGNGSGKSVSALAELVMATTGVFPYSQRHLIDQKFKGPIQARLVVESLTTTLETIILPKLMWWRWSGVDAQGGEKGHWGLIPKSSLIDGEWLKSYSQKLRMLRVLCRDPYDPEKVIGESTIQCMSVDQDATDFASGDFHFVLHDEPPPLAIWRENEARTMRVDGRLMLAMTWPDDPAINVDWLYNEVYEPGRTGNDPAIRWFELWTTENQNLKQDAVATQAAKWSTEIADVRIYGRPIRFSNRIHPEFSDGTKTWCFNCDKAVAPMPGEYKAVPVCPVCQSENLVEFNHVQDFDLSHSWPTVFVIDPHPRKPHMFAWIQISPSDDWSMVAEGKCEGDCTDVFRSVSEIEGNLGLFVAQRLMDPNMGAQPSGQRREINWRDEFAHAGLMCDPADDSSVGRTRINTMLKPDLHTHAPRLIFHKRCKDAIYQMERFVWDNWSSKIDKDEKQKPKEKYDDYPACLRYLANSEPNFRFLKNGAPVIGSGTRRKRAYA